MLSLLRCSRPSAGWRHILVLTCALVALAGCGNQTSGGAAPIPTATPTLTPTVGGTLPTPAPTSAIPTVAQSWGNHAASVTFSTTFDATHEFQPQVIAADGAAMTCGLDLTLDSHGNPLSGQIGLLQVASKQFQAMPYPDEQNIDGYPPYCMATDGRYYLLEDSDAPGETGASLHVRYWSYDTQTAQLRTIATAHDLGMFQGFALAHGKLAVGIESFQGDASKVDLVDMSTGASQALQTSTNANQSFTVHAFTWPYLSYSSASLTTPTPASDYVLNVQTNSQSTLPTSIDGNAAIVGEGNTVITGDTLFAAANATTNAGTAEIDEVDHIGQAAPTAHAVFAYPDNGQLLAANARLIVFTYGVFPLVWDRAEQHLVLLTNAADLAQSTRYPVQLTGDFLLVVTQSGSQVQATIYNTASLPTS